MCLFINILLFIHQKKKKKKEKRESESVCGKPFYNGPGWPIANEMLFV